MNQGGQEAVGGGATKRGGECDLSCKDKKKREKKRQEKTRKLRKSEMKKEKRKEKTRKTSNTRYEKRSKNYRITSFVPRSKAYL